MSSSLLHQDETRIPLLYFYFFLLPNQFGNERHVNNFGKTQLPENTSSPRDRRERSQSPNGSEPHFLPWEG